ncbi:hypothetical protein AB0L63_31100 [Nocardia sp. NPDC051990]|uniref:hypothetical protein n=1 Tax=Nocardia sp. NPDC051990 TaxID=3155285 RepID=UPI0034149268
MPTVAGRPLSVVAALFAALLAAFARRYGYHRDELYFLAAGRHLDWGYPDQPVLTPLLANAMSAIDADSLLLLRLSNPPVTSTTASASTTTSGADRCSSAANREHPWPKYGPRRNI